MGWYPNLLEGADSVVGQTRGNKEWPNQFWQRLKGGAGKCGLTNSGRDWRERPKSVA